MKPTPEFQLDFLSKLQRIFSEGDFTATYKFALLISLADLAVELGRDDNDALKIPYKKIGLKFVQLYWQQSAPYRGHEPLVQNLGKQAGVVTAIANFRRAHPSSSIVSHLGTPPFQTLINDVTSTVKVQPIKYIQNFGNSTTIFLFETSPDGITLLPGVAYCLRRFQPLVQQLSRSHWVAHIKGNKRNALLQSYDDDLESFLFESSRQSLTVVAKGLQKISNRCHYCEQALREADVDHFIPHALYPRDLAHNFVLAHPTCNRSKSDALAAKPHLNKWLEFVQKQSDNLAQIGHDAGIVVEPTTMGAVARWGYSNAVAGSAQAWVRPSTYETIDASYLALWTD